MRIKDMEKLAIDFNTELVKLTSKYRRKGLHDSMINDILFTYRLTFHNLCYDIAKGGNVE